MIMPFTNSDLIILTAFQKNNGQVDFPQFFVKLICAKFFTPICVGKTLNDQLNRVFISPKMRENNLAVIIATFNQNDEV